MLGDVAEHFRYVEAWNASTWLWDEQPVISPDTAEAE
jgi:hypothetical protein